MDIPEYSPTVLYDIFYETGTRLIGQYVFLERMALERGDGEKAREWERARRTLRALRADVNAEDTQRQKELIALWDERYRIQAGEIERAHA